MMILRGRVGAERNSKDLMLPVLSENDLHGEGCKVEFAGGWGGFVESLKGASC